MPVALVTGASRGIGLHTALALARAGHRVFASMRSLADAAAVMRAAERAGVHVETLRLDVTDPAAVRAAVDHVVEHAGDVPDVVVSNAAVGALGAIEEVSDDEWRAVFDTNLFGVASMVRAVVPRMRERGFGRLVHIGSIAGRIALPGFGAYSASKAALASFTAALRRELRPHGVHVCLVEPGATRTDALGPRRTLARRAGDPASPYRSTIERIARLMQLNYERIGMSPQRVAHVVVHAATDPRPAPCYLVGRDAHALALLERVARGATQDVLLDSVFDPIMSLGIGHRGDGPPPGPGHAR